ncbi:MAG: penicillin-binding protein 2 [Clostridia bacterium]|nr:penicillin-binding protein 2 [Clostridia bacterium]
MKETLKKIFEILSNRAFILSLLVIIISVVYVIQLFNIQIVNGQEYREKSEKKMLRNKTIVAPRGEIYDRNGVVLATNKLAFDVHIYKVKVDNSTLNNAFSKLIKILEENSDKIYSTFPISEDHTGFSFTSEDEEKSWKKELKIPEGYKFNQVVDMYIDKYDLKNYDRNLAIKIIMIRYEANYNNYSLFKSTTIAKDISEKSVARIEEEKASLQGIETVAIPKRYYPNISLANHVLGYVSKISSDEYNRLSSQGYSYDSIIGKYGVEQTFEKYLKGTDGVNKTEVDSLGIVTSEQVSKEPISGDNVTLTIDYRLQKVAEQSLIKTINDIKTGTSTIKKTPDANAGAVVVLDTQNGEVLAMASYPTFDTNQFVDGISRKEWNAILNDPLSPMINRVVAGRYSPGSTFKMLVGLAGLENKAITVDEKINDPGIYPYGHNPKCWLYELRKVTHGNIDLSQAIKVSCNCYFYEVGRRLGVEKIIEFAKLFGLGEKTGIELKDEISGQIAGDGAKTWYLGETLSAAIGQSGNSYTPIELVNYISTIANGGNLNQVTLIKNIQDKNKSYVNQSEIDSYVKEYTGIDFKTRKINLDSSYIDSVKQGMLSVTSEVGGTSYIVFKNSSIEVAGKTGTAQVSSGSNNGIFVGFAPYDKPRIAVVAIIEHGGEGTYTANVVKPIMEEYFNISKQNESTKTTENVNGEGIKF